MRYSMGENIAFIDLTVIVERSIIKILKDKKPDKNLLDSFIFLDNFRKGVAQNRVKILKLLLSNNDSV